MTTPLDKYIIFYMTTSGDKKYFFDNFEVFNWYAPHDYTELAIRNFGYHNHAFTKPALHMRRQPIHTIHFVISGKGYLFLNDKRYDLSAGDVFYLDDKSLFSYYPEQSDPWEYVFFEFYGSAALAALEGTPLSIDTPVTKAKNPFSVRKYMHLGFEEGKPTYAFAVSAFFHLIDAVSPPPPSLSSEKQKNRADFVEEVKSYISLKFYDQEFTVDKLCKTFFISHSHMCRLFKLHEGESVITYVKNLRLSHAAQLLLETNYSLKDIAMMSGFKEYEYFFRSFKKYYKITPTDYRIKNKK